ncbi:hypothetical protein EDB89DRAFT_2166913 [Lactarius sanguifluus]|nr:hypothetical protein EDB89DRAFT_2166913 [Lactarius sanguifluus]
MGGTASVLIPLPGTGFGLSSKPEVVSSESNSTWTVVTGVGGWTVLVGLSWLGLWVRLSASARVTAIGGFSKVERSPYGTRTVGSGCFLAVTAASRGSARERDGSGDHKARGTARGDWGSSAKLATPCEVNLFRTDGRSSRYSQQRLDKHSRWNARIRG